MGVCYGKWVCGGGGVIKIVFYQGNLLYAFTRGLTFPRLHMYIVIAIPVCSQQLGIPEDLASIVLLVILFLTVQNMSRL